MVEDNSEMVPEAVEEEEKQGTIWCPNKGHQKNTGVCKECESRLECVPYCEFRGIDRHGVAEALDVEISRLKTSVFDTYYELGQTLRKIRDGAFYKELGYGSLDDYADKKHGFRYRKAAYLIAIIENCEAAGIPKEDVRGIDWSKMKEIIPTLTEENRAEWLKKAATLSVKDLHEEVKKSMGEEPGEKKISIVFALSKEQKDLVDSALEIAAKLSGSSVKSFHLEILAQEFLATYNDNDSSAERFKNAHGGGGE